MSDFEQTLRDLPNVVGPSTSGSLGRLALGVTEESRLANQEIASDASFSTLVWERDAENSHDDENVLELFDLSYLEPGTLLPRTKVGLRLAIHVQLLITTTEEVITPGRLLVGASRLSDFRSFGIRVTSSFPNGSLLGSVYSGDYVMEVPEDCAINTILVAPVIADDGTAALVHVIPTPTALELIVLGIL